MSTFHVLQTVIGRISVEFLLCARQDEVLTLEGEIFKIGTSGKCEIRFDRDRDVEVAEHHCTLVFKKHKWYVLPEPQHRLWVNEKEVTTATRIPNGCMLFLGKPMGPGLRIFGQTEIAVSRHTLARLLHRGGREGRMVQAAATLVAEEMGRQKAGVRRALRRVKRREKRRFRWLFATLVVIAVIASSAIAYQAYKIRHLKALAQEIFYTMKALEVQVSQSELRGESIAEKRQRLAELNTSYENYLAEFQVENAVHGYDEQLILRTARTFGECELEIPENFVQIVKEYIKKWQTTGRLRDSIMRSLDSSFVDTIAYDMLEQHLPPYFYYIALQESDFDINRCGPVTRFGIAKGMWQFMPATALHYGLKIGPLAQVRVPDPRDERHDFEKSSRAAARFLKQIYSTEAQASGLLVLASYNYGENRVRGLIRTMNENPRERNFWNLMKKYKLPKQTRDYVFYIFSAAVIGQNPKYFGFDFDNPLAHINAVGLTEGQTSPASGTPQKP